MPSRPIKPINNPDSVDVDVAEAAEVFGRRIALALSKRHFSHARDVLEAAVFEFSVGSDSLPDRSLADMGLSLRICNMLESSFGVRQVRDLRGVTTEELLATPNCGPKTVDAIWQTIITAILQGSDKNHGKD